MNTDHNQLAIERVLGSSMSIDRKMIGLLNLETQIERDYVQGTSAVKPISHMTPDDLVD